MDNLISSTFIGIGIIAFVYVIHRTINQLNETIEKQQTQLNEAFEEIRRLQKFKVAFNSAIGTLQKYINKTHSIEDRLNEHEHKLNCVQLAIDTHDTLFMKYNEDMANTNKSIEELHNRVNDNNIEMSKSFMNCYKQLKIANNSIETMLNKVNEHEKSFTCINTSIEKLKDKVDKQCEFITTKMQNALTTTKEHNSSLIEQMSSLNELITSIYNTNGGYFIGTLEHAIDTIVGELITRVNDNHTWFFREIVTRINELDIFTTIDGLTHKVFTHMNQSYKEDFVIIVNINNEYLLVKSYYMSISGSCWNINTNLDWVINGYSSGRSLGHKFWGYIPFTNNDALTSKIRDAGLLI